jgi:hypothetical protein
VIHRSLWIGDHLYTVSDYTIQAHTFGGFDLAGSVAIGEPPKWYYSDYGGSPGGVVSVGGTPPPVR